MGVFDWLWQVALKKAAAKGVKAGLATALSPAVLAFLKAHGITVEVDEAILIPALAATLFGAYEFIRNWLKGRGLSFLP